ncbi:hypothetical protein SCUCBS95973_009177 [Sporothrix curviconia]|uniref:Uncharacterized protein n=1 Tax=Sporothrix curviconia TaxID=1260050 RepID=A0ABP0CTB9_9PEZI
MPPANTRAALSAATPASASAMASLASTKFASRRTFVTSSSPSSSSSSSFFSAPPSRCARWQTACLPMLTSSRRPLPISARTPPSSILPTSAPSGAAAFSTTRAVSAAKEGEAKMKRERRKKFLDTIAKELFKVKEDEEMTDSVRFRRAAARRYPFPHNKTFQSQKILGESMREAIYRRVCHNSQSIKSVAASSNIDMRRAAAVVRLKEIEKKWEAEGKFLAIPYHDAVHGMIGTHEIFHEDNGVVFENVNEIHSHAYTKQQLFVPTSESRQFNREDAARAFHPRMLSPDKRVPIPELIEVEKDVLSGDLPMRDSMMRLHAKATAEQKALAKADREADAAEEEGTTRVDTDRFQFRIRDINADNVGADGRSPHAVGWRYGVPFDDRKSGQVKIPTRVG